MDPYINENNKLKNKINILEKEKKDIQSKNSKDLEVYQNVINKVTQQINKLEKENSNIQLTFNNKLEILKEENDKLKNKINILEKENQETKILYLTEKEKSNIIIANDDEKGQESIVKLKINIREKEERIAILEKTNKNLIESIDENKKILNSIKGRLSFDIKEGEKLMCVVFRTGDQSIIQPIMCKNKQKFNEVENLLYEKCPQFKESENYFLANGNKVNKSKTLEENKIKDDEILLLKIYGEEFD